MFKAFDKIESSYKSDFFLLPKDLISFKGAQYVLSLNQGKVERVGASFSTTLYKC